MSSYICIIPNCNNIIQRNNRCQRHAINQRKIYYCKYIYNNGNKCDKQSQLKGLCYKHQEPENKRVYYCQYEGGCNKRRQLSTKLCHRHSKSDEKYLKVETNITIIYK